MLFGHWCWVTATVWAFFVWAVARCSLLPSRDAQNKTRTERLERFDRLLWLWPYLLFCSHCLFEEWKVFIPLFIIILVWALRCLGKKNRNLEFISQQRNKFSNFFFWLSTSTVLTSKNIFIIYNFISWFCFFPMLNILRERLMLIVKEIDHYTEPYPWTQLWKHLLLSLSLYRDTKPSKLFQKNSNPNFLIHVMLCFGCKSCFLSEKPKVGNIWVTDWSSSG